MANTSAPEAASRRRVIYVFLTQGIAGLLLVVTMTVLRFHETALIVERLGPAAPLLIVIFFAFALTLSLVKYELTSLIYVSLGITAYMAMSPLFGMVITAWMAVLVAIGSCILAMAKIGPRLRLLPPRSVSRSGLSFWASSRPRAWQSCCGRLMWSRCKA